MISVEHLPLSQDLWYGISYFGSIARQKIDAFQDIVNNRQQQTSIKDKNSAKNYDIVMKYIMISKYSI